MLKKIILMLKNCSMLKGKIRKMRCGIDNYDKLPSRVGWVDIDYLRWELTLCDNPTLFNKLLLFPHNYLKRKSQIREQLDNIIIKLNNEK